MPIPASFIRATHLSAQSKVVLMVIESYAGKNSEAFPSLEVICRGANMDRRVVQKIIRELEGIKILKRADSPKRSGQGSTKYRTRIADFDEYTKCPSISTNYERSIFTSKDGNGYTEKRIGNKIIVTSIGSRNPAATDDHPDSCDCFHCQRSTEPASPNARFTHYRSCDCLDCHKINFPED